MALQRRTEQLAERTGQLAERTPSLDETGLTAARTIHNAVLAGGEPVREVVDVLHGTWLGHPLHPVLTDITIGAWTLGTLFDAIGYFGDDPLSEYVGDALIAVGTASALPTAVAGLSDYSTVPKPASGTATWHALLNVTGLTLYTLSLLDRSRGRRRRGLLLSALGMGVTSFSAWLGGHLVYKHNVGVNHSESFSGPNEWQAVLERSELPEGEPKRVSVDGKGVLLYRDGEEVYAIGAVCSHAGGPLEQGEVRGCYVQCPWHDSVFDLRDGGIKHGPATQPQPSFDARIRDGQVELRLRR